MVTSEFDAGETVIKITVSLDETGSISDLDDIEAAFDILVSQTHVDVLLRDIQAAFHRALQLWITDPPSLEISQ